MKAPVESATLDGPTATLTSMRLLENDLKAIGKISTLSYSEADEVAVVDVVLAEVTE